MKYRWISLLGFLVIHGYWVGAGDGVGNAQSGQTTFPTSAEITIGMEGAIAKREGTSIGYVPQGWIGYSFSYFPDVEVSFYGDFLGKAGWDTAIDTVPYTISGVLGFSRRGESLFAGLELGLQAQRAYDVSRQIDSFLVSTLSYTVGEVSFFIKPGIGGTLGLVDSFYVSLEPGVDFFIAKEWVTSVAGGFVYTRFSDNSQELSLIPTIAFDWYPSFPLTLNLQGGYARRVSDTGTVLEETVSSGLSFLWYPHRNVVLTLATKWERVSDASLPDPYVKALQEGELKLGLPASTGSLELFVGGDISVVGSTDALLPTWKNPAWTLRVGIERSF